MMKYSIVYSSRTGNTEMLAEKLKTKLPENECVYYGEPDDKALEAGLIFAGFWTDKGDGDEKAASFLEKLRGKKVFLFGTAGFGESSTYFDRILAHVEQHLDPSNTVDGTFMCQGKMPMTVRTHYESMMPRDPEKVQGMIENFDRALSHPDEKDLEMLAKAAFTCI